MTTKEGENLMTTTGKLATGERADLLQTLEKHRHFLRFTVRDLTDEQAAQRPTVSALCLGGLIKHVAATEQAWMDFVVGGAEAMTGGEEDREGRFNMAEGETLAELLDHYEQVARRTDRIVSTLPDLDMSHPLPEAPWFEPGARWSARRVLLHVIAETSQHAGHADIIRESLDGAKTMG
ncbi:DinB family protein [Pseudonocardia bannensis]|uniref:DinB family protein n=1 Tax=Pseudonocardia bannensis TaxID=630973 RepID=A0A848DLD8_9PSEU|nr:DinB family protein [Pseudonocardia bannensis]NMH93580.1 DinB family protein [Pseudonocardia bannensis]